ncbi:MAG: hypothetical protein AAF485_08950 [Chloroflexota bacterium]
MRTDGLLDNMVGFGSETKGGSGGEVVYIDTLKDTDSKGSLRYALETVKSPRIVIPRVSGVIFLEDNIEVEHPFLTLYGMGMLTTAGNRVILRTHDIIFSDMRFRLGDKITMDNPDVTNSLFIHYEKNADADKCSRNIYIRNASVSWCMDTNIGIWNANWNDRKDVNKDTPQIRRITIERSIISEPQRYSLHSEAQDRKSIGHARNLLIGGGVTDISLYHNLFAHAEDRNAQIKGGKIDMQGNVFYNCGHKTRVGKSPKKSPGVECITMNYQNNLQIDGPNNKGQWGKINMLVMVDPGKPSQIFLKDNVNKWRSGQGEDENKITGDTDRANKGPINERYLSKKPIDMPFESYQYTPIDPDNTEAYLKTFLAGIGAGAKLGTRDKIDQRITKEVLSKTGEIIDIESIGKGKRAEYDNTEYKPEAVSLPNIDPVKPDPDEDEENKPDPQQAKIQELQQENKKLQSWIKSLKKKRKDQKEAYDRLQFEYDKVSEKVVSLRGHAAGLYEFIQEEFPDLLEEAEPE